MSYLAVLTSLTSKSPSFFHWTVFDLFIFLLRDSEYDLFSVFTSHVIRTKIVTIQYINSRIWDMIDDCIINKLAKNQISAVFHSRAIRRSVLPKFRELCLESPCLCPSKVQFHFFIIAHCLQKKKQQLNVRRFTII